MGHLYLKISPFAMPCVRHAADDRGEHESCDEWEQHQVDQTLQPIITHSGQCLHIILHRNRQRQHYTHNHSTARKHCLLLNRTTHCHHWFSFIGGSIKVAYRFWMTWCWENMIHTMASKSFIIYWSFTFSFLKSRSLIYVQKVL